MIVYMRYVIYALAKFGACKPALRYALRPCPYIWVSVYSNCSLTVS